MTTYSALAMIFKGLYWKWIDYRKGRLTKRHRRRLGEFYLRSTILTSIGNIDSFVIGRLTSPDMVFIVRIHSVQDTWTRFFPLAMLMAATDRPLLALDRRRIHCCFSSSIFVAAGDCQCTTQCAILHPTGVHLCSAHFVLVGIAMLFKIRNDMVLMVAGRSDLLIVDKEGVRLELLRFGLIGC